MFQITGKPAQIINALFQSLLITYLLLLLVEEIWPKAVTLYLNINYLLIIVIALGIADAFTQLPKEKKQPIRKRDYAFITALAIIGAIIIKYKTADLEVLSWIISVIAGALIYLTSALILEEDDKEEPELKINPKKATYITVGILFLVTAILPFITTLNFLESARIIFGSVFVLFLPGFTLTFAFFKDTEIDLLERIALSFALSIAIVPLVVFYLNLIGIKISTITTIATVVAIIGLTLLYLKYEAQIRKFFKKTTIFTKKHKKRS